MNPEINFAAICIADGFGAFLAAIMLGVRIWNNEGREKETKLLRLMLVSVLVCSVSDILCFYFDGRPGTGAFLAVYLGNLVIYLSNMVIGTLWIVLLIAHAFGGKMSKGQKILIYTLDILGTAGIILNFFVPLVFSVSADNVYSRGPLFWLYTAIEILFVADGVAAYFNERKTNENTEYFPVWEFMIPAMAGILVQSFIYGISTIWPAVAIAVTSMVFSLLTKEMHEQEKRLLEEGRLIEAQNQLKHEQLRSEVLNYMIDKSGSDPVELLKNFAERLRVLLGCDQVIYRDMEETRIMVNSPAIEETWHVPMEYCLQCEHFDAHHPMYAGGFTEMDNCQEGWQGIPVYHECPIKSSLTRIVYCDGEVAGYLAIHYVQNYHSFTDIERSTLEEFTRILSMSLSRYKAQSENRELKLIAEMQQQLKDSYDRVNEANLRNELIYEISNAEKWSYIIGPDDSIISYKYAGHEGNRAVNGSFEEDPMVWSDSMHPDDRKATLDAFFAAVSDRSGSTPYDVTYRMKEENGQYTWHKSSGRVILRDDGTREIFGMSVDITYQMEEQQKRLLGAIPLSNDVLTKANIGLWSFELDEGRPPRMYVDDTMLGLIGLDHQVTPELTYHAWYDNIDDGSYDLVNDAVAKMMTGEHAEVQYPWHYPDGRTIVVRCGGVQNFEYTKGIRIEGTHQDVTQTLHFDEEERKRAKQMEKDLIMSKLRADSLAYISDNEPDIDSAVDFFGRRILDLSGCDQVVYRGLDGHRIVVNAPGICDVPREICAVCPFARFDTGVFGEDGMVLMNDCSLGFNGVMAPHDCPAKSSLMQMIYSGSSLVGKLTVHYLNDYHTFSENSVDLLKTVGVYLGLMIGRINEKKAELARLEAESSSKAKTEFLFNMSHDIRTPMNAILGYTDIALNHIEDPGRVGDSLKKIKTSGGHLLSLINDILEMSRIEAGRMEIINAPLNVFEVIETVTNMSRALASSKDISFVTETENIRNPYVFADELHTNQVIINLISNAIKYTGPGGTVVYRVEQTGEVHNGTADYRVTVKDNGIGMSDEFQNHLFESFSRENTSTVSKQEGAGLGLAIVRRILDVIGGSISVESAQGEGSTFIVELPLKVMNEAEIEEFEASRSVQNNAAGGAALEGRRVLLVEDNEMNREIAAEILEEAGLVTDTAPDGAVAVAKVSENGAECYDFILMDIQMPVMDGFGATAEIRKLPGGDKIPIIALSANAFKEDIDKSLAAGMNAHIAKPIDIRALLDTMKALAEK